MWLLNPSSQIATNVLVLNSILRGVSSELILYLYLLLVFNILLVTVSVAESVSFFSILFACGSQHHHFHLENCLSLMEPPIGLLPVAATWWPSDCRVHDPLSWLIAQS